MGTHRVVQQNYTFGIVFFKKLCLITLLLFSKPLYPLLTIAALIGLSIGSEFAGYHAGLVPGKMYKELISANQNRFWLVFWTGSLLYIGKCLLSAAVKLAEWILYLLWRKNTVEALQERYFSNRVYYKLNCVDDKGIDNPDQRITQDVERMCNQLAINILPDAIIGPIIVAWYTWKTWASAGCIGVAIPYGYFIIGTIVNIFLMSPMAKWSGRVEKAEGDFRFKHVSIRVNAESSAFYNAEEFESAECKGFFKTLLTQQTFFYFWGFPTYFWKQLFDYYGVIVTYLIQFISMFVQKSYQNTDSATMAMLISNHAFLYITLVNSFTRVTDVAMTAGQTAGVLQRVADFMLAAGKEMDYCDVNDEDFDSMLVENLDDKCTDSPVLYWFKNVGYSLPTSTSLNLVKGMNAIIQKGQNILVTGSTGIGKSSFFRILAGLWQIHTGTIERYIRKDSVMHLPQRPYFPTGNLSLMQQIYFPQLLDPSNADEADCDKIQRILESLHLEKLVERCGSFYKPVDFEWQDTLTPGEQQRLSFARVLYRKPSFVILDEATSNVGTDIEDAMYRMLQKEGITYMSAGHRSTLAAYHNIQLHFDDNNGYVFRKIDASDKLETDTKNLTL